MPPSLHIVASRRTHQLWNWDNHPLMVFLSKDLGKQEVTEGMVQLVVPRTDAVGNEVVAMSWFFWLWLHFLDESWRWWKNIKNIDSNHFQDIGVITWFVCSVINVTIFTCIANHCLKIRICHLVWDCKRCGSVPLHICSLSILQVICQHHQKQSIYPIHWMAVLAEPIAFWKIIIGTPKYSLFPQIILNFALPCYRHLPLSIPCTRFIGLIYVTHFLHVPVNFMHLNVSLNSYSRLVGALHSLGGLIVASSCCGSITGTSRGVSNSHFAMTSNLVIDSCLSITAEVTGTPLSIPPVSLVKRSSFFDY